MSHNGAPKRENGATRAPPPLPPTKASVKAFARLSTMPAARSWPSPQPTPSRLHNASTGRSPAQPEAPPRRHQHAPATPQPHHQGGAGPASPLRRRRGAPATTPQNPSLVARAQHTPAPHHLQAARPRSGQGRGTRSQPSPATVTAGHSRSQPGPAPGQPRPLLTSAMASHGPR